MAALVHKLDALSAFGKGVLGSIAVMKERLGLPEGRAECLTDPKLAPVRKHFSSHFPMLLPEKVRPLCLILEVDHSNNLKVGSDLPQLPGNLPKTLIA